MIELEDIYHSLSNYRYDPYELSEEEINAILELISEALEKEEIND